MDRGIESETRDREWLYEKERQEGKREIENGERETLHRERKIDRARKSISFFFEKKIKTKK